MCCSKNLALLIGGRNNLKSSNYEISIDVYDLVNAEWVTFPGINRFRHVSWISYNKVFTHGGFESKQPNVPINLLTCLNLKDLFENFPELKENIEAPNMNNNNTRGDYQLNANVLVA